MIVDKAKLLHPIGLVDSEWRKEGIEFHWWINKTPLHTHGDFYEIFFITQGSCIHTLNNKSTKLVENMLVLVPPFSSHEIVPEQGSGNCTHLNISIEKNLFKNLCDFLNPELFNKIEQNYTNINAPISNNESEYIFQLIYSYHSINTVNKLLKFSLLKTITVAILNCISIFLFSESLQKIPDWLSKIIYKINFPEYLTKPLSEIYKLSNYSTSVFLNIFKQYMGETLVSYMIRTKINYACQLLTQTDFTILHISSDLGYDSLSHFSYIFRKHKGLSPMEYKKLWIHKTTKNS